LGGLNEHNVNVKHQLEALENFVADNEILPLDEPAIHWAADIYATLRRSGQLISEGDILIAGIALANHCALATNNTTHYSRVPGLQLENWAT
jgi:tRNA(fMet)-specific endonuclease VapC